MLLYKYPEWYVVDLVGVCIAGGVSALIGISLSVIPVVVLLVLLAIYDAISVYKTKHMIAMAEGIMDLKLPILFVIPKHLQLFFLAGKLQRRRKARSFFHGTWRCRYAHSAGSFGKRFHAKQWRNLISRTRGNVRYPCRTCSTFDPRNERKTSGRPSLPEFRSNPGIFYWCPAFRGINNVKREV